MIGINSNYFYELIDLIDLLSMRILDKIKQTGMIIFLNQSYILIEVPSYYKLLFSEQQKINQKSKNLDLH
jgi:hypothetical protein